MTEIKLSGLQVVAFPKAKKAASAAPPPPDPAPQPKKKRAANAVPQPAGPKKKKALPANDIPADAVFVPPDGMTVLPCPATVDMSTLRGKLICHRFAKADWPSVFGLGGKAQRVSSDSAYFEIKYPGFRELYLHTLAKEDYGADKTWCLYG